MFSRWWLQCIHCGAVELLIQKVENSTSRVRKNTLIYISSGEPSCWPTNINKLPDVTDFCISKCISWNFIRADSSQELNSDHSPIIVTISSRLLTTPKPARLQSLKTDRNVFQSLVDENLSLQIPLKCKSDVEEGVEPFNRVVQNAAWTATLVYMRKIHSSPCNPETKRKIN